MDSDVYIMVVDDDPLVRESLSDWIYQLGYKVTVLDSGESALKLFHERQWDVVLLDAGLPGIGGLKVIEQLRELNPDIPVILLSDPADISSAAGFLGKGATDYIIKPFAAEEAIHRINNILSNQELKREVGRLKQPMDDMYESTGLVGRSDAMRNIFDQVKALGENDLPVIINGEPGTGKESIARAFHAAGPRRYKPFVMVGLGATPENILESELFGHDKGAFTGATFLKRGRFELAGGGTLFLDKMGPLSREMNAKLARVIEERTFRRVGGTQLIKFDIRFITAVASTPEASNEDDFSSQNLFGRKSTVTINVPPLRDRPEDIQPLVDFFLHKYSAKTNKRIRRFSAQAINIMHNHPWTGNVRELKNSVERAVMLAVGDEITPDELPFPVRGFLATPKTKSIKAWEKLHIQRVLDENSWNISKSAKDLQIDRVTLYNKIKKYKIEKPVKST